MPNGPFTLADADQIIPNPSSRLANKSDEELQRVALLKSYGGKMSRSKDTMLARKRESTSNP